MYKMKTLIITDSSTTNIENLRKIDNLQILPLMLIRDDGKEYFEDILDVNVNDLNSQIEKSHKFSTSCTPIGYSEEIITNAFKEYDNVIVLTISKGWSSQFSHIKNLEKKFPNLFVCDTSSYGFILEYAINKIIEMLDADVPLNAIREFVEDIKNRSVGFFSVKNISGLLNSGRIPKIIGNLIKIAKLHPILKTIEVNKKEAMIKKWENCYDKMIDALEMEFGDLEKNLDAMTILVSDNSDEEINLFKSIIQERTKIPVNEINVRTAPIIFYPTVCSGAIGIQYIKKKNI